MGPGHGFEKSTRVQLINGGLPGRARSQVSKSYWDIKAQLPRELQKRLRGANESKPLPWRWYDIRARETVA